MNIMVVDDEYFARKALVQTIRNWNPEAEVMEAEDGLQAWSLLSERPADLVLSDIRMPLLDGIELAARLYLSYPDTINVIISGFDDFNYAQQAIRYKVERYLLKPVDKAELLELLEQVRDKALTLSEKRLESQFASSLYDNEDAPADLSGSYTLAVVRFEAGERDCIKRLLIGKLRESGIRAVATHSRRYGNLIVLHLQIPSSPDGGWEDAGVRLLAGLVHRLSDQAGVRIDVGLSRRRADPGELGSAYREAREALLHRFVCDRRLVVYAPQEPAAVSGFSHTELDEWQSSLYRKACRGAGDEAGKLVRQTIRQIVDREFPPRLLLEIADRTTRVVNLLNELASGNGERTDSFMDTPDWHGFGSADEAADLLGDSVEKAAAKWKLSMTKNDLGDRLISYVEQHYRDDIVLEQIARNVFFTDPTYLSRIFKKKTGVRFSQYVLSLRMSKAKTMLESDGSLPVSEVASSVGFNDYSYFIQMYKKVYGETPGQTRKQPVT
ncbi:response regulator [Paenibacillus oceani]|uniref:Response regulator n=1 Tax=Paenibacillus oceani TaxID=2772510 RepID=A0A927CER7_9BACL|nr:response regulator [Paenibacillus oceani]MBD2865572.1 response regulator [Paenibacillus oceani]